MENLDQGKVAPAHAEKPIKERLLDEVNYLFSQQGLAGLGRVSELTLKGGLLGIADGAKEAWSDKEGTAINLAFSVGSGLVLGLAERAKTLRVAVKVAKAGFLYAFAQDAVKHGREITAIAWDTYKHPAHYQSNTSAMERDLGRFAFDTVFLVAVNRGTESVSKLFRPDLAHGSTVNALKQLGVDTAEIAKELEGRATALERACADKTDIKDVTGVYKRRLDLPGMRGRYRREQATSLLHYMYGFDTDAPMNMKVNLKSENGKRSWIQEDAGYDMEWGFPRSHPSKPDQPIDINPQLEQAFAERLTYGDTDNHLKNIVTKWWEDGKFRVANLDFEYAFGRRHPRGYKAGNVPSWGNLDRWERDVLSKFEGKPISPSTLEKFDAFLDRYDAADLMAAGLTRREASATLARTKWFSENKHFPNYKAPPMDWSRSR